MRCIGTHERARRSSWEAAFSPTTCGHDIVIAKTEVHSAATSARIGKTHHVGWPAQRRSLAHLLHDGNTDQPHALLPIRQPEFGLSYAGLALVRAPFYTGVIGAGGWHRSPTA